MKIHKLLLKSIIIFCISFLLIFNSTKLFAQQIKTEETWNQKDFYPILPWDFIESGDSIQYISDCNFSLAGFLQPADIYRAEKHGLKAIVHAINVLSIYGANKPRNYHRELPAEEIDAEVKMLIEIAGESDAIMGYYIMDEPWALDFGWLGKAVDAVKKYAPGKLAYINLLPSYAPPKALGSEIYTEYLERYVNEVNPQFISYDNYMVQYSMDLTNEKKDGYIDVNYFSDLLDIRKIALKYNLPYWNIISSNQIREYTTIPSLSNMLLQAYTSLAAGFDGISWYKYTQQQQGNKGYSPMDYNKRKTPTWYYLKEVNRQISILGPFINTLTSTGVYFTSPAIDKSFPVLPGEITNSLKCESPLMVGEFVTEDDNKYVMVVNINLDRTVNFTFSTKNGKENCYLFSLSESDIASPVFEEIDINNHNNDYWLIAGGGILIKIGD